MTDQAQPERLHVTIAFEPEQVVLALGGVVDRARSPELASIVAALAVRRCDGIVLDLADVDFMDGSGL